MRAKSGFAFGTEFESRLWHSLLATSVDAIIVIDEQGDVLAFNPAAESMFGYAAEDVLGENISRLMPEPDGGRHDDYLRRYLGDGQPHVVGKRRESVGKRADGGQFPIELSVSEVSFGDERVFIGNIRDITAHVRSQEELMISERRLSDAQRIAKLGHWDWNILTNELHWSDEIYRIFGLGVREFEATYPAFLDRVYSEDRQLVEAAVARAIAGEASYSIDHRIVLPSGEVRFVHETAEVTIQDGRQARMLGTVQDITERKLAERAIQAALDEKEILFKEVHHRVKNNLQIIAGILTLQMSLVTDPATVEVLRSTEQRVRAMALVHERLYATNELKRVDIAVYLNELIDRIVVTLASAPAQLRVEKDFEALMVDLDTAVPCGLIVSELMTNSIKYGVCDGRGRIHASLRNLGHRVELQFQDDGPGWPHEIDLETSPGLGLRLVQILVKQLRAGLEIKWRGGMHYTLSFPLKETA